jgi:ABC-type multidrug transport system fused ATPase/permease subunit
MAIRELLLLGVSRVQLLKLAVFTIVFTFFEGLGVSLLLPVLEYVIQGEKFLNSHDWPVLGELLNLFGPLEGLKGLFILLLLSFISLGLRSLFQYLQDVGSFKLSLRVSANLRQKAIRCFLMSDFFFLSSMGTSRLLNALTTESARAGEALKAQIVLLTSLSLLVIYFLLLCWLSFRLMLLTLPVFLLASLAFHRVRQVLRRLGMSVSRLNNSFLKAVSEQLRGMVRVKMRTQEQSAAESLYQNIEDLVTSSLAIERRRMLVDIGMFPALVLSAFGVLFVAVAYLGLTLSSLGLFLFIMMRLAPQFTAFNSMWSHANACLASFRELDFLIESAHADRERWEGHMAFTCLSRGVDINGLCFSYPGSHKGKPALQNISFSILKGSMIALVGRSGAGKSTLVKLAVGFYQPTKGEIRIDGKPLDEYDLTTWRRKVAYLTQETFLFDESIRANLNFGLAKPLSPEREIEILTQSNALEFVSRLEKGLETQVGEGGQRLSQGQKQRLALAQALAVEPELLILDEPTSALDSESESAIQDTLMALRGRLTMIVVAHRLSTIKNADQIVLLDYGNMKAQGPHEKLLEDSSLYRSLFESQLLL